MEVLVLVDNCIYDIPLLLDSFHLYLEVKFWDKLITGYLLLALAYPSELLAVH